MNLSISSQMKMLLVLLVVTSASITASLVFLSFSHALVESEIAELSKSADLRAAKLADLVGEAIGDTRFLIGTPPIGGISRSRHGGGVDPRDGSTEEVWKDRLSVILGQLLRTRPGYLRARFIDGMGREVVRVERTASGEVFRTTEAELQDKSAEVYTRETLERPGRVYVSSITFNREHGSVASPPTRVLRVALAIEDEGRSTLAGFVVINVAAQVLMGASPRGGETLHFVDGDSVLHRDDLVANDADTPVPHPDREMESALHDQPADTDVRVGARLVSRRRVPLGDVGHFIDIVSVRPLERSTTVMRSALGSVATLVVLLAATASLAGVWVAGMVTRPITSLIAAIHDAGGSASTLVVPPDLSGDAAELGRVMKDLTEGLDRQVRLRTAELEAANDALQHASEVKDRFLATMSHELRTPLTGILSSTEALEAGVFGDLTSEPVESISLIEKCGTHLLSLINDLLDISRLEEGRLPIDQEELSVASVVEAAVAFVAPQARDRGQAVQIDGLSHDSTIQGDARRLKQILVNLLSNAMKFSPKGGRFGMHVRDSGDLLELTVWDEGRGIAAEDLPRLFQPFEQLDGGLGRDQDGSGLGLYLSSRLAQLHGGQIRVSSAPGRGSRFTLVLPRLLTSASVPSMPPVEVVDEPATPPPTAAGTVLVVDDNVANQSVVVSYLRRRGFDVLTAQDGVDGVAMAERLLSSVNYSCRGRQLLLPVTLAA